MTKRVPWLLPAMGIVVAACSSSPNMSNNGGATGDVTTACSDAAGKVCGKLASCSPLLLQLTYSDMNGCNNAWKVLCQSEANANGTPFTGSQIEACGMGLDSASCADAVNAIAAGTLPGCDFHGKLAQGAPCAYSSQCDGTTSYCPYAMNQLCGVCSQRGAVGAKCTQTIDCQAGLLCSSMSTCVTPGAVGSLCNLTDKPCGSGLTCTGGKCAAWTEDLNAKCDPNALLSCNSSKGLFCNGSGVCAMVSIGSPGGACGATATLSSYTSCPGSVLCPTTGNSLTGTCPTIVAAGAACDGTSKICQPPMLCAGGTCQNIDPSACH